jgi:hypothetical protein
MEFIKTNINGFEIEIYETGNGDELFISKNGETVYSCRTINDAAMDRAIEKIARF